MGVMPPRIPLYERFWKYVRKEDWHWRWTGPMKDKKYGYLRLWDGREITAHRYSWLLHCGELSDGVNVLHRCDTPWCVNPDHLWAGSLVENNADRDKKGRTSKGEFHYSRRHPEKVARGERVHSARLRPDDVRIIRERHAAGESQTSLGARYGVTQSAIWAIINGKSWKHIV
jgi:hypothetical protein